jgi:hypothetical protein
MRKEPKAKAAKLRTRKIITLVSTVVKIEFGLKIG